MRAAAIACRNAAARRCRRRRSFVGCQARERGAGIQLRHSPAGAAATPREIVPAGCRRRVEQSVPRAPPPRSRMRPPRARARRPEVARRERVLGGRDRVRAAAAARTSSAGDLFPTSPRGPCDREMRAGAPGRSRPPRTASRYRGCAKAYPPPRSTSRPDAERRIERRDEPAVKVGQHGLQRLERDGDPARRRSRATRAPAGEVGRASRHEAPDGLGVSDSAALALRPRPTGRAGAPSSPSARPRA